MDRRAFLGIIPAAFAARGMAKPPASAVNCEALKFGLFLVRNGEEIPVPHEFDRKTGMVRGILLDPIQVRPGDSLRWLHYSVTTAPDLKIYLESV